MINDEVLEEVRQLQEQDAEDRKQAELREIVCPDCGAKLRLVTDENLPHDLTVVFVEHCV